MIRIAFLLAGIALGAVAVMASPSLRARMASLPGMSSEIGSQQGVKPAAASHEDRHDDEGIIKLSDAQIEAAGITTAKASEGALARRLTVPGAIVPSGDRIARVAVKLVGTVAELRKRLGDTVEQNEVVAVIESREVADAKSEYLAARTTHELQKTLFERSQKLWDARVTTENDYLRGRATAEDARIKMEVARQKLSALGLSEAQIAALLHEPAGMLRRQELRSPIKGRIAERRVDLGALVGREGQESELYVIVDMDVVWADLAVPPSDLPSIREGQKIVLSPGTGGKDIPASIIFISPLLDRDTRAARVVATVENTAHTLRPGSFVTAEVPIEQQQADVLIPKSALQTIKGERSVFVRSDEGFEVRKIKTGREDTRMIEVLSGLAAGDAIAVTNTFTLKAEHGKAEAAHDD